MKYCLTPRSFLCYTQFIMKFLLSTHLNGFQTTKEIDGTLDDVAAYLRETRHDSMAVYSELDFPDYRLLRIKVYGPTWRPLTPDMGDLLTLEEFQCLVFQHTLTDYDGTGYFAKKDSESNVEITPGEVEFLTYDEALELAQKECPGATHVVWYNK